MASRLVQMLGYGLRLKCPRCGVGPLFLKPFRMYEECPNCALKFEREQGYFIGAMYINYAATVAIAVPGFFLLDAFTGMTINQQLALWVPFAIIFPARLFPSRAQSVAGVRSFFQPSAAALQRAAEEVA